MYMLLFAMGIVMRMEKPVTENTVVIQPILYLQIFMSFSGVITV